MTNLLQRTLLWHYTESTPELTQTLSTFIDQHNWDFSHHLGEQCFVLATIHKHTPESINGQVLAKILSQMTQRESAEGGPYFSSTQSTTIDFETNVLIGYFLSQQEVALPNLSKLFDTTIAKLQFSSELFPSHMYLIYFLSTYHTGEHTQLLIDYLISFQPVSMIDNLLILLSLQHLGAASKEIQETISEFLLHSVDDLEDPLSNALYKELLQLQDTLPAPTGPAYNQSEESMMNLIVHTAEQRCSNVFGDMKYFAMREIKKTIKGNPDKQMSLMSLYVKQALGPKGERIDDDMIAKMGLANIFYWTAFIIYDDFWDEDETANPRILPTANFYARHYSSFFSNLLPSRTGFGTFFHSLMDTLDAANTWETVHCRAKVEGDTFFVPATLPDYGDYERKFEPTSGQILGPVAQFVYLGFDIESQETTALISYFRHYLIAMQINDDAHDWEEDMQRGTLSTVVVMLLEAWREAYPDKHTIDLKADKETLHHLFWFHTIARACKVALDHTARSRKALQSIHIFEDTRTLERYISRPEKIALKGLKEQRHSVEFLEHFETATQV